MIDRQRIMDETRCGLDILLDLYPQAKECVGGGSKRMFKMRPDEKTASATIRQNRAGEWVVHDFGGKDEDLNGIDAWMDRHGYDRSRFGAAVQAIAQEFGIRDELRKDVNVASVVERAAREDEQEGQWYYEIRDFTDRELKILGPGVTADVCRSLNWYALEWLGKVKDRRIKEFHSSDRYPIFLRECFVEEPDRKKSDTGADRFFKVYKPLEPDKKWRFMSFPASAKPRGYIFGLYELRKEHERLNKEANAASDDEEVGGTKRICDIEKSVVHGVQRYYRVVLCSGERDSLCVKARGDLPVWLNSETPNLDRQDYDRIIRLAGELTNIPDLDTTGIMKGAEKALKFMDLKTVWLPQTLHDSTDNRGRPCKDFRDWCALHPSRDEYYALMDQAVSAQFWVTSVTKNGDRRHKIDALALHHFLSLNGFHILRDESQDRFMREIYGMNPDETPVYVRVKSGIVYRKSVRDMREFLRRWSTGDRDPDTGGPIRAEGLQVYLEHGVRNLILTDVSLTPAYLGALQEVSLSFQSYTPHSQDFFFQNGIVHCHGDGYDFIPWQDRPSDGCCVWAQNVIPHQFRKEPPLFTAERLPSLGPDGQPLFRLELPGACRSHYLGYLINSSRLYWRQEIEDTFRGQEEQQEAYLQLHRFDISGGGHLTEQQRQEQEQCLLSKLFTLGYLMHQYKDPSRPWAPYAMDNRVADSISQANGRSGKSFFFTALKVLRYSQVGLSGRNDHLMDNAHVFDQVTRYTRLVMVDDLSQRVQASQFYDVISGDMTINPKGLQSFTIPYRESPKFAFSTNYVPTDFDPSSDARLLYLTFSDYYHQRTDDNPFEYRETRRIFDDFQKNLFGSEYSWDEWNADFNLLMQCEQFYLSLVGQNVKLQPPMKNILQRKLKADMGEAFEDWATAYFCEDGPNVNHQLIYQNVYQDFLKATAMVAIKPKGFTARLKAFVRLAPWISAMNPADVCNSQGRNVSLSIDPISGERRQTVMLHMRTVAEEKRLQQADAAIWGDEGGNTNA